jgi:murein DD-endopeptidase MepM/ murein hydrolase activator NlpD
MHIALRISSRLLSIPLPMVLSAFFVLDAGLTVGHRARAIRPGEVVLLTISSSQPLREVQVSAFDRSFPCYQAGRATRWSALVGIDLDAQPGRYEVAVTGFDAAGGTVTRTYPLTVVGKIFPTRKLTVEAKYVSPPREALTRIEKDAERVGAIFAAASPERYWSGPFVRPVRGRAISAFGKRSVYNGQPRSPHSGTDFSGAAGTPIKAPNAGRVVLAADLYYSGKTLILDHGQGLYSYFGHMSALSAGEGDMVAAGEIVGKVGATGVVTGPHLHWSVRLAGTRVDPLSLLHVTARPK